MAPLRSINRDSCDERKEKRRKLFTTNMKEKSTTAGKENQDAEDLVLDLNLTLVVTTKSSLKAKVSSRERTLSISDKRLSLTEMKMEDKEEEVIPWDMQDSPSLCSDNPDLANILKNPTGTNIFSHYNLGQELGSGGFATTYLCTEKKTGTNYACKAIKKDELITQGDISGVQREVEIMQSLPIHPHVVQLLATYEDHEAVYLVMELCEGGELFDRIATRLVYEESDAAVLIKAIIEAIKVCHLYGIMHRDLKPENLLFASKEETAPLKAIDFGLSTFFAPGERFNKIVGTKSYMAPELLMRDYGPEVDIWSAGIILYILLCGHPPFYLGSEEQIEQAIMRGRIDFEGDLCFASHDATNLLRGMLNRDPRKRFTAQQVLEHPWLTKLEAPNLKDKERGPKKRLLFRHYEEKAEAKASPPEAVPYSP